MKYIKIAENEFEAWQVSADLWRVIGPEGDVTAYLASPVLDPETQDLYFLIDDALAAEVGLDMSTALPGYPPGATRAFDGVWWVSRHPRNVNEPTMIANSTWSRSDGTWVWPAGWKYLPGEDVTEDGGATWWRALESVAHPPSESPAQYVQVDGRFGAVIPEPTGPQPWVPWDGQPGSLHGVGAQVTHNGDLWQSLVANNVWEPGVPGTWENLGPAA